MIPIAENSIIDFLARNPDFLVEHPELLDQIAVPHGFQGKTVSLVEYQARLLREKLRVLQDTCESQRSLQMTQRSLGKGLKVVVAKLYECHDDTSRFDVLENFLTEHYHANCIRIYAQALCKGSDATRLHWLRPLDPGRRGLFTLIMNNPKPLCDSLQLEHLLVLFGSESDSIHSSLLLPFQYRNQEALLALGSDRWHEYAQSLELDLLSTVIEIISRLSEDHANSFDS